MERSHLDETECDAAVAREAPAVRRGVLGAHSRVAVLLALSLLSFVTAAAYSNNLDGHFIFDDEFDIATNASIRRLWPPWCALTQRVDGQLYSACRPVANLSFALNYAVGGIQPRSYHLTNIAIHILAGLALFGVVRRTLLLPRFEGRFAPAAVPLATAVSLLWLLHPLQTGAVSYTVQRYESLMGLCYFAALYSAVRCGSSRRPAPWAAASITATLLALGSKEVAVSLPVVILLYDRALLAGSFRESLRHRRGLYLGLASVWGVFAAIQILAPPRPWAGFGLERTWYEYARSQPGVILHYLRLACWPRPLVLDYGWPIARTAREILPGALIVGSLLVATVAALLRGSAWGFLGAWFFLILAPTSSVMPLLDLAFEHRMYLPLAAVVAAAVLGGFVLGGRLVRRFRLPPRAAAAAGMGLVAVVASGLGVMTWQRNASYVSNATLWQANVDQIPGHARPHYNLGLALAHEHRIDEAIVEYRKALAIKPDYVEAHGNLGLALAMRNRTGEAIIHYQAVLRLHPSDARGFNNLAWIRATHPDAAFRQADQAVALAQRAVELSPESADSLDTLAAAYAEAGRFSDAVGAAQRALALASQRNDGSLADALRARLRLYQAGQPYRDRP